MERLYVEYGFPSASQFKKILKEEGIKRKRKKKLQKPLTFYTSKFQEGHKSSRQMTAQSIMILKSPAKLPIKTITIYLE